MNQVGVQGEQIAGEYLESQGYTIVCRNFRCRIGELDIVAKKDGYLVFCEVKSRLTKRYGAPMEAVHRSKQQKIVRTAEFFMLTKGIGDVNVRFDVIEVFADKVNHVQNAFWAN